MAYDVERWEAEYRPDARHGIQTSAVPERWIQTSAMVRWGAGHVFKRFGVPIETLPVVDRQEPPRLLPSVGLVVDPAAGWGRCLIPWSVAFHGLGLDGAPTAISLGKSLLESLQLAGRVELRLHVLDKPLPVADGSADVIVDNCGGFTYGPDPMAFGAELTRATAPGGSLLTAVIDASDELYASYGEIQLRRPISGAALRPEPRLGGECTPKFTWTQNGLHTALGRGWRLEATVEMRGTRLVGGNRIPGADLGCLWRRTGKPTRAQIT